jgi:hypothetical protein
MQTTGIIVAGRNEAELLQTSFIATATRRHVGVMGELLNMPECDRQAVLWALCAATRRWEADVVDFHLDRFQFERSE